MEVYGNPLLPIDDGGGEVPHPMDDDGGEVPLPMEEVDGKPLLPMDNDGGELLVHVDNDNMNKEATEALVHLASLPIDVFMTSDCACEAFNSIGPCLIPSYFGVYSTDVLEAALSLDDIRRGRVADVDDTYDYDEDLEDARFNV